MFKQIGASLIDLLILNSFVQDLIPCGKRNLISESHCIKNLKIFKISCIPKELPAVNRKVDRVSYFSFSHVPIYRHNKCEQWGAAFQL